MQRDVTRPQRNHNTVLECMMKLKEKCNTNHTPTITVTNWMAPWKNRICSTTMKLRKSLVSQWRGRIYRVVRFFHPRSSCTTH